MKALSVMTLLIALLSQSTAGLACSRTPTMRAFKPDQLSFETKHDSPLALKVPTPIVKIISVRRATSSVVGSCDMFTFVELEVSVPPSSAFSLADLGFVFRAEPGKPQDPYIAFPNFPVISLVTTSSSKVSRFRFGLTDSPANWSKPFRLAIDVLAINNGLQIGDSAKIVITHP